MRMTRGKRTLRAIVLSLFGLGCALTAAALLCAFTAQGRRGVADGIEALVSDNIPGRLEIGELTQLRWGWLRARDVRFFHPDGRCVLHVVHAEVEPDLGDVWRKRLTFKRVAADGGKMLFTVDPDGRLSFEAAVSAPSQPGEVSSAGEGLHYGLRNMHVDNFSLEFKVFGDERYKLTRIRGTVHVWRIDTPGTRVKLQHISGTLTPEVAGAKLKALDIDGIVRGNAQTVADLHARIQVDGDDELALQVLYRPHQTEKVKVRVLDKEGVEATTVSWLMHAAAGFSADVSVEG